MIDHFPDEFYESLGKPKPGHTFGLIDAYRFQLVFEQLVPGIKVETGFPWSMAQGGEISFAMSKAKELLDFEPKYTLADSIRSIKEWVDAGGLDEERPASDEAYGSGVGD